MMSNVQRFLLIGTVLLPAVTGFQARAAAMPASAEYTLPPANSWLHGRCGRHACNLYQSHAVRDGVYLSKHSTLYTPRVIVDIGADGRRGRVQLAHVPFSLCASTHGDECTVEVKVGKSVMEFGLDRSSPLEVTPAQDFVRFAGDTESFAVSYLDEQRKRVRIRFDAAQVELRPSRLDR